MTSSPVFSNDARYKRLSRNFLLLRKLFFWGLIAFFGCFPSSLRAGMQAVTSPLERGFAPIPFVSPQNLRRFSVRSHDESHLIRLFCQTVRKEFKRYRWPDDPCGKVTWKADLKTSRGHPLIYTEFGSGKDVTLFLGGVHPDELTPIHLAFRFARYLKNHPHLYEKPGFKVIIAPLVNPDGFFRERPLRTNGTVDVNRNFFTLDWYDEADDAWRGRRRGMARYFPGYFPNTEIETLFQVKLIDQFKPDKIFSVHAPLGFLDYDGPGDQKPRHLSRVERRAKQFVHSVSKKSRNYRVVDYSFYPGSLGNFAGNERNLPTVTLELETTIPSRVEEYWEKFLPGFVQSVQYPFKNQRTDVNDNATRFFGRYYVIVKEEEKSQG